MEVKRYLHEYHGSVTILVQEADALRHVPDLGSKLAKVWRMISGRKANTKIGQVHKGDTPEGDIVHRGSCRSSHLRPFCVHGWIVVKISR